MIIYRFKVLRKKKIRNLYSKYKELSGEERLQKIIAKNSFGHSSEKEYYEHSLHLADGEESSKFMKKK